MKENYFISERLIPRLYFTAPMIAKIIKETSVTVHYWSKEFNVPKKKAKRNAWLYPRESVAMFHAIQSLLRIDKFSMEGAKLQLERMSKFRNIKIETNETEKIEFCHETPSSGFSVAKPKR